MERPLLLFLGAYWLLLSLITVIITILDKSNAIKNRRRIPEKSLMLLGLLGAALPEYIAMKTIRHKTKHKKFMLGLPVIMLFHALLIAISIFLYNK